MNYCRQFDLFDPLTAPIPLVPYIALRNIGERGRRIIGNATLKQIIEAAESIEWIIDRAVVAAEEEAVNNGEEPLLRGHRSDAQWLRDHIYYYDIRPARGASFPHYYHCFAVLALWKIADANFSIQPELDKLGHHQAHIPVDAPLITQWTAAGTYAIDAMEAVCLAEELASRHAEDRLLRALLPNEDSTEAQIKERISVRARAAAIKKHATNRAARLRTIELYKARNYLSVEAAAQAIAALVCKSPRTVAKWLYDERKGRTPSSPNSAE